MHTIPNLVGRYFPTAALVLALSATVAMRAAEAPAYVVDHSHSAHAQLRPLPIEAVEWTSGFWAERYRQLVEVSLAESWRLLADPAEGHVLENFRFSANPGSGSYQGTTWQDEWLYKWIEAAASVWRLNRDPALRQRMDEAIALIAAAQQPDGYLSTMPIVSRKPRFQEAQDHEVYNMGHLLTAGVIHHRMTGQGNLLAVARRTADFLCANLGVTVKPYFAHNPSAIMGLVELHRLTGEKKYLDCAQLIVDQRGAEPRRQPLWAMKPGIGGTDIIQDRVPVRATKEVVGHNVFFTYLYTGAGDVVSERGDAKLSGALDRLWADMTGRKMFIHGGVSAHTVTLSNNAPAVEAAGAPYELPNSTCYNETCGQIGAFMWGYRQLVNRPDAALADIMEREMFNGFLACVGLEGKSWFYRAPLRRYDENTDPTGWQPMLLRISPGRREICCPSNLLRTIAQLGAYFYSRDETGVWVHQFGGSKLSCELPGLGRLVLEQVTDYPWGGAVRLVVREAPARPMALRIRRPGWATSAGLALNGQAIVNPSQEHGYMVLQRTWRAGDELSLTLPLESQLMVADPRVEATRNQVAVMRGPVVYCAESPDLPAGIDVPSVFVASEATFKPMAGIPGVEHALGRTAIALRGTGLHRAEPRGGALYRPLSGESLRPFELTLIPYFAWANRGRAAMSVWLPVVLKGPTKNSAP